MSDHDKDVEILALRHQIAVLQQQLGRGKVQFAAEDRAFLAALLTPLPVRCCAAYGCWSAQTPCSAGTAT